MLLASLSVAAPDVVPVGAVVRPLRRPEAASAVPAAGVVSATGAIPWPHHAHEVGQRRSTLPGPATVPTASVAPRVSPEVPGG